MSPERLAAEGKEKRRGHAWRTLYFFQSSICPKDLKLFLPAPPFCGNCGIGVAFVAAQKYYKFIAVMPANLSIDKQVMLRYLRVEVMLVGKKLSTMDLTLQEYRSDVTCLSPADPALNGFKGAGDT
ncbi:hypothetical protein ABZP36_023189 [Zizania latifolia]